jgi:two-component system chemotaxis response regulator CheB
MFRTAAIAFGPRVIGVVLTGNLDDGTSGLAAIKRAGGLAVAQHPDDAAFPSMPRSAIEHVQIDRVVAISGLAATLGELIPTHDSHHAMLADLPRDEGEIGLGAQSASGRAAQRKPRIDVHVFLP